MIKGKNIFIPGGAGSIGSELVRQLAQYNRIFILDIDEESFNLVEELKLKGFDVNGRVGSILDKEILESIPTIWGTPDWVFNCAARKYVTPMQLVPMEAVRTNVEGNYNLLEFAEKYKSKFLLLSSDKAVNEENIMGWSKKGCELFTKNYGGIVVRFGNVMGSKGSVLASWQKQIDKNESLTVTDAGMMRYMMTIPEAVSLIIKAAEKGEPSSTWAMDMGKQVNILQLAKDVIKASGKDVGITMIGKRPGETLYENLMTPSEEARAIKNGQFWVFI